MNAKICMLTALAACIGLLLTGFSAGQLESSVTLSFSGVVQQTSTGTYSYIISVSGSNYQMTDGTTGQIDYQSTNATQVVNDAIGNLTQGHSILFSSGIYNLNGSITGTNENNITLAFANEATLFVENGMNAPAISLTNCNNWLIQNPTINGNAANQANAAGSGGLGMSLFGILIMGGSNNLVDGAHITNCGQFGFLVWGDTGFQCTSNGIINSLITYCGWNGIAFNIGSGGSQYNINSYAENNEVAYCGDVGISTYGLSLIIENNYVHDMNGTSGYNNAHFGIAVEGGSSDIITQNTIQNCYIGVDIGPWNNCTISSNTISCGVAITNGFNTIGVTYGMELYCSSYNTVEDNYVTGATFNSTPWAGGDGIWLVDATFNLISGNYVYKCGYSGIQLYGTSNNNTVSLNYFFDDVDAGIDVYGNNNYISQNQVYSDGVVAQWLGICMETDASNNVLIGNNVHNSMSLQISDASVPENTMINNIGYNPVGYIAKPISSSYLIDGAASGNSGGSSTWISGTTYTNSGSPKELFISGGTVTAIVYDGQTLYKAATTCTITLQPDDTFSITFSTAPTIKVFGQ